jgi:hypothetical protein
MAGINAKKDISSVAPSRIISLLIVKTRDASLQKQKPRSLSATRPKNHLDQFLLRSRRPALNLLMNRQTALVNGNIGLRGFRGRGWLAPSAAPLRIDRLEPPRPLGTGSRRA